jgi:hypothetical protein
MSKYRGKKNHRGEIHSKIFVWSHTEKAEIEYFQEFKQYLNTHRLMPRKHVVWTPQELLDHVIKWKKKNIAEKDSDQVWCIFDVDSFAAKKEDRDELLSLIAKAHLNKIKIAYINECFELWILLHFDTVTSSIKRGRELEGKIQKKFKSAKLGNFEKNQKIFTHLITLQKQAISNAKKLVPDYNKINWERCLGSKGNPSTSIHFLIEEINNLMISA